MFTAFCTWYFNSNGWEIKGDIPSEPKYIVAVGPHTSSWDFIIGVAVRKLVGKDIKYLAKKELFKFPFKNFFLKLGGFPVDRSRKMKLVDQVIEIYNSKDEFSIAITPEGTRKRVSKLKSGFYNIAVGAKIPIYMSGLDYEKKEVIWKGPIYPGGDLQEDLHQFINFFKEIKGKNPELGIFADVTV